MNAEIQELAVAIGAAIAERIAVPKYLTVDETAAVLRMHPMTLRKLEKEGKIKCYRHSAMILFSNQQIRDYVESKEINHNQ